MPTEGKKELLERIRDLQERLDEAEETLRALRSGEVDAVVTSGPEGDQVYTLRGADEAYRVMVQNMGEGALTLTLDGLILFSNEQFASLLGIPLEHVIGSSIRDFVAAEDAFVLSALLVSSARAEAQLRLKKGSAALVPAHLSANRLSFDSVECVCLIVTDLTEQKRNQEIVAAERLARSILDQAAGAILVIDPAGRIIRASRAAGQLANTSVLLRQFDEVFSLRIHSDAIAHSSTMDYTFEQILSALQHHGSVAGLEATARVPDRQTLDVIVSAGLLTGDHSECLGCIVQISDISGVKRAERALRESEERFRALVTATSHVLYRMSPDWSEMRQLSGGNFLVDTEAPIRGWLGKYIHSDDQMNVMAVINESIRRKSNFELEHRVLRVDGTLGWTFSRAIPVQDAKGEVVEWFGAASDVTERKRAEEEVRRLNAELEQRVRSRTAALEAANKELEAFAFTVAHDLRSPLRGIDGWSLALLEDYGEHLDAQAREHLDRVRAEAQHMGQLIDDLLQLSRIGQTEIVPSTVDLTSLAQTIAAHLKDAHPGRTVEFTIDPGLTATGDPRLLEIALTNLLDNAVKFTCSRPQARIEFGKTDQNGQSAFFVRDNGVGFDMRYVGTLFGTFQRLHNSSEFLGTGIGLATVKRVIDRHGGRVWAEGRVGEGASFYFTIRGNHE